MAKPAYTCIVFFENRPPAKYRQVFYPNRLWQYCTRNLGTITAMNIYNKITKEFIKQAKTLYDAQI